MDNDSRRHPRVRSAYEDVIACLLECHLEHLAGRQNPGIVQAGVSEGDFVLDRISVPEMDGGACFDRRQAGIKHAANDVDLDNIRSAFRPGHLYAGGIVSDRGNIQGMRCRTEALLGNARPNLPCPGWSNVKLSMKCPSLSVGTASAASVELESAYTADTTTLSYPDGASLF